MKLIIEVTEDYYDFIKNCTLKSVSDITILDGTPYEERPQGEWVAVDSYSAFGGSEETWLAHGNPIAMYYCSNCKNQAYANDMGEDILSNFCPNCGADMRGERR